MCSKRNIMHLFRIWFGLKKWKGEIAFVFIEIRDIYPYIIFHIITETWKIHLVCAHTSFDNSKPLLGLISVLPVLNHSQWTSFWLATSVLGKQNWIGGKEEATKWVIVWRITKTTCNAPMLSCQKGVLVLYLWGFLHHVTVPYSQWYPERTVKISIDLSVPWLSAVIVNTASHSHSPNEEERKLNGHDWNLLLLSPRRWEKMFY